MLPVTIVTGGGGGKVTGVQLEDGQSGHDREEVGQAMGEVTTNVIVLGGELSQVEVAKLGHAPVSVKELVMVVARHVLSAPTGLDEGPVTTVLTILTVSVLAWHVSCKHDVKVVPGTGSKVTVDAGAVMTDGEHELIIAKLVIVLVASQLAPVEDPPDTPPTSLLLTPPP